ncbi:hypothetical protein Y032_0137g2015 [Ancylostoma ceylanicum]|uniref:Uncharacterized protein n=1 Tax=Ancylostoma ceylanicum TaxID=53326 RepID=A0A016T4W9_9BILA|nr:hypothetical protein Y032_0137g2015 [Ancylostoma ceylanicum]
MVVRASQLHAAAASFRSRRSMAPVEEEVARSLAATTRSNAGAVPALRCAGPFQCSCNGWLLGRSISIVARSSPV